MDQKIVLLFVFFFAVINAEVGVHVSIYYEALSPESAKFITKQVYPALNGDLKEYITISWIPFGKTNLTVMSYSPELYCGEEHPQCYENKIHACAVTLISHRSYRAYERRERILLEFIYCMMKECIDFPNDYPADKCAHQSNVTIWPEIHQCANSHQGVDLLTSYGVDTKLLQNPLTNVPTVVFNGKYDEELNKMAQHNFIGAVCKHFTHTFFQICGNSAVSIAGPPLLGIMVYALAKVFF